MKLSAAIATLFGLGRVGLAPGTVASAVTLAAAWILANTGGRFSVLLAGIAASAIGAWSSTLYAEDIGNSDPSECVIDEVAGQFIACAFAPVGVLAYLEAFALFRLFDIVKPWPISRLERFPGGIGIMADDVGAGLAAGLIVAILAHARLV